MEEWKEITLRRQIVAAARRLDALGMLPGSAGNISARLGEELILATPSAVPKASLQPEEVLVTDLEGKVVRGIRSYRPTSELPMHLEVYRQRADAMAVVHAHPAASVALTLLGVSLQEPILPEAVLMLGEVPTTHYATPSTPENQEAIRPWIKQHDVILLARHGAIAIGSTVEEATTKMIVLEHTAQTLVWAHILGKPTPLSQEEMEKLLQVRQTYGKTAPGDEK